MRTEQITFTAEEMEALRELAMERIQAKRAAAEAAAAAEAKKQAERKADEDRIQAYLNNPDVRAMHRRAHETEEAINRTTLGLGATPVRRW